MGSKSRFKAVPKQVATKVCTGIGGCVSLIVKIATAGQRQNKSLSNKTQSMYYPQLHIANLLSAQSQIAHRNNFLATVKLAALEKRNLTQAEKIIYSDLITSLYINRIDQKFKRVVKKDFVPTNEILKQANIQINSQISAIALAALQLQVNGGIKFQNTKWIVSKLYPKIGTVVLQPQILSQLSLNTTEFILIDLLNEVIAEKKSMQTQSKNIIRNKQPSKANTFTASA